MNPRKLLDRIRRSRENVRFADFERLIFALGFRRVDIEGSHRIFEHHRIKEARLNLQPLGGQAKAYQVKQLLGLIERYNLSLEDDHANPTE